MHVYQVYIDLGYDGTVEYGVFSTRQKARAWIRKSSYKFIRVQMNDTRWGERRSIRALCEELMKHMEPFRIQEYELDPEVS